MSRLRHITKTFALLAMLTFLILSFGCSADSVVAPAYGPEGITGSDSDDTFSAPEGPSQSQYGGVSG